jgi:hypothetical protein
MHRAPAFAVVGVLIAAAAGGAFAASSSRVAGAVSVCASPPFSIEPGFVDLLVRHVPQKGDRALVVEIESAAMFRSSLIPLDGADAPAVHSTRARRSSSDSAETRSSDCSSSFSICSTSELRRQLQREREEPAVSATDWLHAEHRVSAPDTDRDAIPLLDRQAVPPRLTAGLQN